MEIYTSGFKLKLARTNREANRWVFIKLNETYWILINNIIINIKTNFKFQIKYNISYKL